MTQGQKISIRRKSREMFIDKNEVTLDPSKIKVSARITNQSNPEELRYNISSSKIKKDKLDNLFLKYPHNTKLLMEANEVGGGDEKTEIHFTMEKDVNLVFDALSRKREVPQIPEQRRKTTLREEMSRLWTRKTTLGTELAELMIHGRPSKMKLDKKRIERCNDRTRLRKEGKVGLLQKLDWSNCLDYNQITSADNDALKRSLHYDQVTSVGNDVQRTISFPFNMESLIEFHQSFLTMVHPAGSKGLNSNYDPIPIWQSGVQAATLNLHIEEKQTQGSCNPIQVNNAMFLDTNGGSGYVLKPERLMTSPETSCIITLKILEGRHLKTLKPPKETLFGPHLEVLDEIKLSDLIIS